MQINSRKRDINKSIYFVGLSLIAFGLPLSPFLMSAGQVILGVNWIYEGQFREKFSNLRRNNSLLVLLAVFLVFLIGVLYSENKSHAWQEIGIKFPLFFVPLLVGTSPSLSPKQYNYVINFFIGAVVLGTCISMGVLYHIIPTKKPIHEVRDISIFISHIRSSLMIVLVIFYSLQSSLVTPEPKIHPSLLIRITYIFIALWLTLFLFILHALTGIIIGVVIGIILLLYYVIRSNSKQQTLFTLFLLLLLPIAGFIYLRPIVHETLLVKPSHPYPILSQTPNGHPYQQDTSSVWQETENGYPLGINYNWSELASAWILRSDMAFEGNDKRGNPLKYTLLRFMTSKGINKDSLALSSLSKDEIQAIENGIANVNYLGKSGLTVRIEETLWEIAKYKENHGTNGHSLTMRIEFWHTAWHILKRNWLYGVGTGDTRDEMVKQYAADKSQLSNENRLGPHNQFLAIALALGIPGLLLFLASLFLPFFAHANARTFLYVVFFGIFFLSLWNEDTLETQAGVTFYVFFNSFLLFANPSSNLSRLDGRHART